MLLFIAMRISILKLIWVILNLWGGYELFKYLADTYGDTFGAYSMLYLILWVALMLAGSESIDWIVRKVKGK
jgi:hypothetical protein